MSENIEHVARLGVDHRKSVHLVVDEHLDRLEERLVGIDRHHLARLLL